MIAKLALITCLLTSPCLARDSIAVQEVRLAMEDLSFTLHSHQSEIDLFHERIASLERKIDQLGNSLPKTSPLERRLAKLEEAHKTLLSDLKTLQKETNSALAAQSAEIKKSLNSLLSVLEPTSDHYVVKPGDSLGQIALNHKTSLKALKQANNLSSDTIRVGQKLLIP